MRVADYIAGSLVSQGVDACFMVTGGGAMHLNDAFGAEAGLRKVFFHHEQAAAMAAEAYARITNRPALLSVTTGPGGINALNGVFGAHTDSIPMIVVSGQVKRETLLAMNPVPGLRQLGDQEVDITSMARAVTKACCLVRTPEEVPAVLAWAYREAVSGRPGPVWIDIPVDIQGARLADVPLEAGAKPVAAPPKSPDPAELHAVLGELARAKRPVILAGSGVRLAGAVGEFLALVERLGIPVTTAWTHDIISDDHPLFAGRPGTIGTRAGNFVVQNADCVLILGSRLNIRQISYNWSSFARNARKVWVDIDPAELSKPFVRPDLAIHADLKPFLRDLSALAGETHWSPRHDRWVHWCRAIASRYAPKVSDYPVSAQAINPYHFVAGLFDQLRSGDIVACGDATATIVPFQIGRLRSGMRIFSNSGSASMGYDLPAAIGAAIADPRARVVCLAGDGSLMMNLQELQTLHALGLNVKVFVLDNGGYLSIKQTQRNFFGRECGASPASGLTFPDFVRVAQAFDIDARNLDRGAWQQQVASVLAADGPVVCRVPIEPGQEFQPRLKSRMVGDVIQTPELEDMYPFLDPGELDAVRRSAIEIE